MINTGLERFIYTWHFPYRKPSVYIKGRKGDKVIIKLNNGKVTTGFIFEVGTKNLTLSTGPELQGKMHIYLNFYRVKINEIKKFAKYPEKSQHYKNIKLY